MDENPNYLTQNKEDCQVLKGMCENNIAMMNEYKQELSIHQTHLWGRCWQSLFLIYNYSKFEGAPKQ